MNASLALPGRPSGGSSLARRISLGAAGAIAAVMLGICAVMAWATAHETRGHVERLAAERAHAAAQSLEAFDEAARQVTERFYTSFAEGFAKDFSLDAASGELRNAGEKLNGSFTAVDKFAASTGGVATIFARKGDDFVRITTSLKKENGDRAMGTMLGSGHPAFKKMMAGDSYTGRAFLFGKHYMTRYQAVKDGAGQVAGILFIGFDLSAFQATLDKMVAEGKLYDTGGLAVIDPKKAPADAVFVAHPTLRGKKVTEAWPGAEKSLAMLAAAGADSGPQVLPVPLLAAGDNRWAVVRKAPGSGWWLVAR